MTDSKFFFFFAALGWATTTALAPGARADVFANFLSDLQAMSFAALPDVQQGMQALQGVEFESADQMGPAAAFFLIDQDTILLNDQDQDPATGMLKHLQAMGYVDSSIVVHELWHSYYWNSFQKQDNAAVRLYNQEYQTRYQDYSSDDWETIQEEGYALFIQEVSRDYFETYLTLKNATPAVRARLMANPTFTRLYEQSFGENFYGYFRGDDGQPVFVTTPITQADKTSILNFFFRNRVSGIFAKDFGQFSARTGAVRRDR